MEVNDGPRLISERPWGKRPDIADLRLDILEKVISVKKLGALALVTLKMK
jgi:hypothetical protein